LKAILDEGVPRQVIPFLERAGCKVEPFPKRWKGLENGELLAQLAKAGFECLVTCDRNLIYQQNIVRAGLAVVVLPGQRLEELIERSVEIAAAISNAKPGASIELARSRRGV